MNNQIDKPRVLVLCLLLAGAVAAVYWPVLHSEFVNIDDNGYVSANPHVQGGLHWENVKWAFQSGCCSNWHPLTWLSHMLDWQLYGANAGGHHLTSLLLHIANTLLRISGVAPDDRRALAQCVHRRPLRFASFARRIRGLDC